MISMNSIYQMRAYSSDGVPLAIINVIYCNYVTVIDLAE